MILYYTLSKLLVAWYNNVMKPERYTTLLGISFKIFPVSSSLKQKEEIYLHSHSGIMSELDF